MAKGTISAEVKIGNGVWTVGRQKVRRFSGAREDKERTSVTRCYFAYLIEVTYFRRTRRQKPTAL